MHDVTLKYTASPTSDVTGYSVAWTYNGSPAATKTHSANDGNGILFSGDNPTITLKGGDTVACSVSAADATDNLSSSPVSAGPVTIPATVPQPPTNVTLTPS